MRGRSEHSLSAELEWLRQIRHSCWQCVQSDNFREIRERRVSPGLSRSISCLNSMPDFVQSFSHQNGNTGSCKVYLQIVFKRSLSCERFPPFLSAWFIWGSWLNFSTRIFRVTKALMTRLYKSLVGVIAEIKPERPFVEQRCVAPWKDKQSGLPYHS